MGCVPNYDNISSHVKLNYSRVTGRVYAATFTPIPSPFKAAAVFGDVMYAIEVYRRRPDELLRAILEGTD